MFINKYKSIVQKVNKINEVMLVATLIIMFVVLLAQIFARFIFFIPLPASQDLLTFFMIASVFLGSGIAVANGKQIALEFLVDSIPGRTKDMLIILTDIISIAFLLLVVDQAREMIVKTKGALVGASPIPVSYYYVVVLIGCIIMIINFVDQALSKIRNGSVKEVA